MADELKLDVTEPETETAEPEETAKPSLEEQISELLAENKRLKRAVDKNASQAADYKKRLSEKMSEAERLADEQADRDAKLAELERREQARQTASHYIKLGYSAELADRAAEAFLNGDIEELTSIQADYTAERDKAFREASMKGMPAPQAGGAKDPNAPLTMDEFNLHKKDPNWINTNWERVQELLRNIPK